MGWEPAAIGGKEFLILSTHGGIRAPDGTPIALGYHTGHWEVGLLMEAAAREFKGAGAVPVRRRLHRSVRRPFAGHTGDVRQPRLSQRCRDDLPAADSIAPDASRRPRRRDLRQGAARHDDGARREPRSSVRARPRRRDASAPRRRRCRTRADHRRAVRPRRAVARAGIRAGMSRVRVARRRVPVPRHCRDLAGGRRSARPVARALGARTFGPPDLAGHGAAIRAGADGARADEASPRKTS